MTRKSQVQNGAALQLAQHFYHLLWQWHRYRARPGKIFIIQNTEIFDISFRLKINIFIAFVIKYAGLWLVSK